MQYHNATGRFPITLQREIEANEVPAVGDLVSLGGWDARVEARIWAADFASVSLRLVDASDSTEEPIAQLRGRMPRAAQRTVRDKHDHLVRAGWAAKPTSDGRQLFYLFDE